MQFTSHSQCGQDQFVWEVTNHKTDGWFLDVGAGHPTAVNNTYALEQQGWRGIMVDLTYPDAPNGTRKSQFLLADATKIDWLFQLRRYGLPDVIDYLSLDVDDATLPALKRFPLDKVRFSIISCEHDSYRLGPKPRDEIRTILKSAGYDLLCEDVMVNYPEGETNYFEDWHVSPFLPKEYNRFRSKKKLWSDILAQAKSPAERILSGEAVKTVTV